MINMNNDDHYENIKLSKYVIHMKEQKVESPTSNHRL